MTPRLYRVLRATPVIIVSVLLLKYVGIWAVAVLFVLVQGTTMVIRRRQATRA